MIRKIKLITHTDLDGEGCAILLNLARKENEDLANAEIEIARCNYNTANDVAMEWLAEPHSDADYLYITDISITPPVAAALDTAGINVKLFDHHKSALDLNKYDWAKVTVAELHDDMGLVPTCGTELFYNFLVNTGIEFNSNVYEFVTAVRNYDTWRTNVPAFARGNMLNTLFGIYGPNKFNEIFSEEVYNSSLTDISNKYSDILWVEWNQIERYVTSKAKGVISTKCFDGYNVGVVFADRYINDVANHIAKDEYDFVAVIDLPNRISLRTTKSDIDLSEIAKRYGGGGHTQAAGITVNEIDIETILEAILTSK